MRKVPFFLSTLGFFKQQKPKLNVVFDIGSGSVGAAVFLLSHEKKPFLASSVREDLVFQEEHDPVRLFVSMQNALENVAKKISEAPIPEHSSVEISCFLSSPWHSSKTRISKKDFQTATEITQAILDEVYKTETSAIASSEQPVVSGEIEIFGAENIHTKLNGYETDDPCGKSAESLEVALHICVSETKTITAIKGKVVKYFPGNAIKFHSFPFASFVVVRDLFHEKNFLVLDIAGENTDVVLAKNNVLLEALPFSAGKNFLLRGLAAKLSMTPLEALSQFRLAENEMLHEAAHQEVTEAAEAVGRDWRGEFQKAIARIVSENDFLPHSVFVAADDGVSRWFIDNIQDEELSQFTLADDMFSVRHVNSPFLASFCDSGKGVPRDPFLMLEGVFLSRISH